jgi:hypothetical protein
LRDQPANVEPATHQERDHEGGIDGRRDQRTTNIVTLGACRVLRADICYNRSMSDHFQPLDRDTLFLFPPSVQE